MCDSMPSLDEDFNFSDINLDFLESPTRPKHAITETQVHHCAAPLLNPKKLFSNDDRNKHTKQSQHQNLKAKYSALELSKRIAEIDTLVRQIRKVERERDGLRKQLEDFHQSAKEVQLLYTNEMQNRIKEQAKNEELSRKYQSLDTNFTAKTLEVDQLQAQLDAFKVPIEYGDLAVRYLKLVQKLDDERALHWHDQAVVRDLQKYCKEKCLKIPPTIHRSPRKRKVSATKVDKEIQCDIGDVDSKSTEAKEVRDHGTQCVKVATRSQGSQHIGTTTTRSTTTACFFKYHDVGVNCNLLDFEHMLNEMLDDMRSWSTPVAPLSPIADLDKSANQSMSLDISPIQLLPSSLSCMRLSTSHIPPLPPPLPIKFKTIGTCTYICNVQRTIDYMAQLPTVKRSNSRPSSRLMFETVKDENTARSTATTPLPSDSLNSFMPSIPNLLPNAFDELWQIFGHMVYGLLQRRVGNVMPFSNQTSEPSNITNQQDFYNWLQNLYLDIHTDEQVQDTQDVRNEQNLQVNTHSAGSTTTESILEQQTPNFNIASPLNFSNAAPVKCTSSGQYLFKPKAQRSANPTTDEESTTLGTGRHSIGTSPIRCIVSSPISTEINALKDSDKSVGGPFEYSNENRTPSAFISPKSTKKEDTKSDCPVKLSETAEKILKLFPSVKNRSSTLQSVRKLLNKNLKDPKKKTIEKRKRKKIGKSSSHIENETAVDFIAKLNFANDKPNAFMESNKIQLDKTENLMNQRRKINTINTNCQNKASASALKRSTCKDKLRELNRCLFGSETDDEESNDEKIGTNLPVTSVDLDKEDEEMRANQKVGVLNPITCNAQDSLQNHYGIEISFSDSTTSSDDSNDIDLNQPSGECQPDYSSGNNSSGLTSLQKQEGNHFEKSETHYEIQEIVDNTKNMQNGSYDPPHFQNVVSTSSDVNCVDFEGDDNLAVDIHLENEENIFNSRHTDLDPSKDMLQENKNDIENHYTEYQNQSGQIAKLIEANNEQIREGLMHLNTVTKNVKGKLEKKSEKQLTELCKSIENTSNSCIEMLNKDQRPQPSKQYTKEIKSNEVLCEPSNTNEAGTLCKTLESLSPSSNSSNVSRLVIDSDVDEILDTESPPMLPKKRGRKRKSESSSPSNFIPINAVNTPCKRSARLLAKQRFKEEQNTELHTLPILTLGKYTRCNNKESIKYKVEKVNTEEECASESACTKILDNRKVMIPVLGYFRENSDHMITIDGEEASKYKTSSESEDYIGEKNKEIEDDELKKYSNKPFLENDTNENLVSPISPQYSISARENLVNIPILFNETTFPSSSPTSPTPLDNMSSDEQSVKVIPLEYTGNNSSNQRNRTLLYNLISTYKAHNYRSFNSFQLKAQEKAKVEELKVHFADHLTSITTQSEHHDMLQLVGLILCSSQDLKIIAHALCSGLQEAPRPVTTSYESLKNAATPLLNRPNPSIIQEKMPVIMSELLRQQPELAQTLLSVIESIIFNVQNADTISVNTALNLTDLYLLTLTLHANPLNENPARLFIAKCLYYHKVKAIPMIYAVLCIFPTTLPHREERHYDRSDALITVIQHVLMCTPYNMENHQLFHRELLSKLRFVYHFEVYKPDFHDVLQNLVEKLRAGKLNNLKYAFALFCKRLQPERVVRDVIQSHLIPLSNEYYSLLQQTTDYDERTAALLDCFSSVIKPFPRETHSPVVAEINNYLNIFKRFLSVVERPIIQEAAVHAILRLQRFSNINCYNALASFRPDYNLQPLTCAALRTFIHRKSLSFWKTLLTQSG